MREVLRGASVPYAWATAARNRGYETGWLRQHKAHVPVVSVGNLTLGGTGKTPCVEYVASYFQNRQARVAILSRGYGSSAGHNDEALLLEENLPGVPHLQGRDRVALAGDAVSRHGSQILILDDGFQHRRLARDLDLLLIDATQPWGYGRLFPRGMLREPPLESRRADVILLTRCDLVSGAERRQLRAEIGQLAPACPVVETSHRVLGLANGAQRATIGRLRGQPVAAFCGIGNSDAFRRTLEGLGLEIRAFRSFPDHHPYPRKDVDELGAWAGKQASNCVVVTTQKDLVKLRRPALGGKELWALRIGLHFESGQEMLDHKLGSVMAGFKRSARVA